MSLVRQLEKQGRFLFRWRSFIPLVLIGPIILALTQTAHFEDVFGETVSDLWLAFSFGLALFGLAVRWITVGFVPAGTSGRNTKDQRAEFLNTDGMYSVVRNPLYLGNFLAWMGVTLSVEVWWFALIVGLVYWIYIERVIAAEEQYLTEKYGETYTQWASKTPVFIPNFKLWRPSFLPLSFRTILRREYNGFFAVCAAFFTIHMMMDVVFEGEPFTTWIVEDWPFVAVLLFGAVVFIALRTIKIHTTLLQVTGR